MAEAPTPQKPRRRRPGSEDVEDLMPLEAATLKPQRRRPGSEDVEDLMPLEAATPVSRPARRSRLEDTLAEVCLVT